ncbi:MAG: zinc ABC transporter substrate-binding protein [Rubrobacteridae bacterium]|nr:zinc ABC transporter substrate-binding protein [Rubrobacteridae bacterium]
MFIYSGAGFEPWDDGIIADLKKANKDARSAGTEQAMPVNGSKGIELLPEKPRSPQDIDPHFYLDPVLYQQTVINVKEALCEVDPSNTSYYESRTNNFIKQLASLNEEFVKGLKNCKKRDIITSHAAFAYLAKRYDLHQLPISGLSDEEPSPAHLAEIVEFIRQNKIKYIFVEKLVSPRLAETIAQETGARLLVLNPIEGLTAEDRKTGKNYVSLMRDNLKNLKIALGCN